jgi:predicted anti-sigma-YlaC factor YlaD
VAVDDRVGMTSDCDRHRQVLSAQIDGASPPEEWPGTVAHLASCGACQLYRRDLLRVQHLVARADLPAGGATPRWDPRPSTARCLLAAVGLAQVVLALPALAVTSGGDQAHLHRHLGGWSVAFGVGLLVAAGAPRHARALLPVALTLALVVVGSAAADLAAGYQSVTSEAVHALELIGVALVALVAREARLPVRRPPASGWAPASGG